MNKDGPQQTEMLLYSKGGDFLPEDQEAAELQNKRTDGGEPAPAGVAEHRQEPVPVGALLFCFIELN